MAENNECSELPKFEVDVVGDNTKRAIHRIQSFSQKYLPGMAKNAAKFDAMYNDLIVEPLKNAEREHPMEVDDDGGIGTSSCVKATDDENRNDQEPELSVHAQYLLLETLNSFKKAISDMSHEHKNPIHHLISRCGKAIDSRFFSDLSKLLKNEKEIENDPDNLAHSNRLILEHLMGLGRNEVAETLLDESEMPLKLPNIGNFDKMKEIMTLFKQYEYLPAIEWVKENAPERRELLFRLQCQHIISLLETGVDKKMDALRYVKELQKFPDGKYTQELAHLMYVVISHPIKQPYEYLFHEGRWFALEEELAQALTDYRSSLTTILSAGAKTVPSLMTMRAFLSSARPGSFPTLPDELPCNVPIPEQVHSSFCCPILKVQSTENNPPVRLCCGHVISTDAMNKLAQQSRNNRLKCPYCPLESVLHETKVLHF